MKKSTAIIGVIFALISLSTSADSFEQHTTPIYSGPSAKPNFQSLPGSINYRTMIRNRMKQGVNFSGHYAIVTFGCGTGCKFTYLTDVKSGGIYDFPLSGEEYNKLWLDYRPDSKLIKASWAEGDFEEPICVRQELVLKGVSFKLLNKTKTEGECDI